MFWDDLQHFKTIYKQTNISTKSRAFSDNLKIVQEQLQTIQNCNFETTTKTLSDYGEHFYTTKQIKHYSEHLHNIFRL